MLIHALPLLAPAALLACALFIHRSPRTPATRAAFLAEAAGAFTLLTALASALVLWLSGAGSALFTRLDIISVTMLLLVGFIGWIVLRYARHYLEGEARHTYFTFWLLLTLSAVLLLVQSGNLIQLVAAWVAVSLSLHKLLLFYPNRIAAQRAARKKFLTARVSDAALIIAAVLLTYAYGTTDISTILTKAQPGPATSAAAAMIALAALLKSAQFPSHGWLTEVMETPTPVSALLHAGVVNGGGFLLIRFADVMLLSPFLLAVLVMIGGFTALFGSMVMLTQPAVKTSLAWSTVAQMGFMILQCGLALFPLALLHIVAHSLYKAHAFLSCGGAVERIAATRRPGPVAVPGAKSVARAFAVALLIYAAVFAAFALTFGLDSKSPQAIALGAILIFGVAYLLAQGLAETAPRALTRRTALYAFATATAYFALQRGAEWLTHGTLPATPAPGALEWALITLALLSFGLVALAQATFPLWAHHPATEGLRVHLSNGLYANALTDRLIGGFSRKFQNGAKS